jgi:ATP-dependent exoDNAse (exonuclease V) alpha subunit
MRGAPQSGVSRLIVRTIELQKALNAPGESRVERFGWTFCPGDKIMQVENDYDRDVYNDDTGIVRRIDPEWLLSAGHEVR